MKRVTLQDIADELGISRNTVSKAINNSDGIAAATRDNRTLPLLCWTNSSARSPRRASQ